MTTQHDIIKGNIEKINEICNTDFLEFRNKLKESYSEELTGKKLLDGIDYVFNQPYYLNKNFFVEWTSGTLEKITRNDLYSWNNEEYIIQNYAFADNKNLTTCEIPVGKNQCIEIKKHIFLDDDLISKLDLFIKKKEISEVNSDRILEINKDFDSKNHQIKIIEISQDDLILKFVNDSDEIVDLGSNRVLEIIKTMENNWELNFDAIENSNSLLNKTRLEVYALSIKRFFGKRIFSTSERLPVSMVICLVKLNNNQFEYELENVDLRWYYTLEDARTDSENITSEFIDTEEPIYCRFFEK